MFRIRPLAIVLALVVIGVSCSSDSDDTSGTDSDVASDTGADDPTSTGDEAAGSVVVIEPTTLMAPLDQEYPTGGLFPAGSVTANWYQADGNYVAVYSGLDLEEIGPACPGNSIGLADGTFLSTTNAPTGEGGCEGATTPSPSTPPRICGDLIVYSTAISIDDQGILFGTFERSADGGFVGATSTVTADAAAAPEIDLTAAAYEFDGTEFAC